MPPIYITGELEIFKECENYSECNEDMMKKVEVQNLEISDETSVESVINHFITETMCDRCQLEWTYYWEEL